MELLSQRALLFVFTLTLTQFYISNADADTLTVTRCYEDGYVPLACSAGSLIHIFNVTYGLSPNKTCSRSPGDCVRTEQTSFGCNGHNTCTISITEETKYFMRLPRCGQMGNYLEVQYECIPEMEIKDICTETRTDIKETEGYLSSPYFSRGYYGALNSCKYRIVGRNIRLHLITVNLTDSHDCLKIDHALSSKTYCGGMGVVENYDVAVIPSNELDITFMSGLSGHDGGIWLHYSMTPLPIEIVETTPKSTTAKAKSTSNQKSTIAQRLTTSKPRRTTTTPPNLLHSWTARVTDDKDKIMVYNNISTTVSMATVATILSLVFGILGTIVISLFLFYFLKRFKDYKKKKARRRSDSSGMQNVMWHNTTNECLSSILEKNGNQDDQCYVNSMPNKDQQNSQWSKVNSAAHHYRLENSFC